MKLQPVPVSCYLSAFCVCFLFLGFLWWIIFTRGCQFGRPQSNARANYLNAKTCFLSPLKFPSVARSPLMQWRPCVGCSTPVLSPGVSSGSTPGKQAERSLGWRPHPPASAGLFERNLLLSPSPTFRSQSFGGYNISFFLNEMIRNEIAGFYGNCIFNFILTLIYSVYISRPNVGMHIC